MHLKNWLLSLRRITLSSNLSTLLHLLCNILQFFVQMSVDSHIKGERETPLQFEHTIYFYSQLFWEKEIWFAVWATHKLSKALHARQMREMFECQMTRVISVVLWFVPARWNDNGGSFKFLHTNYFGLLLLRGLFDVCRTNDLTFH